MPAQTRNAKRQHNSALLGDLICHDDILESILKIGAPQMSVHRALKSRLKVVVLFCIEHALVPFRFAGEASP